MHPTPQATASTPQPPDRAPSTSSPACAEPGRLGQEPTGSSMLPAMAASLAAAMLVACGGGSGGGDAAPGTGNPGTGPGTGSPGTGTTATPASDEEAARFLLQAQFSATDEEIAALRAKGYGPWLAEQFAQPIGTTGTAWLMQRGYGVAATGTRYDNVSYPADFMLWNQLFVERDAVRKRVALALSEIMVVSTTGLEQPWSIFLASGYWDLLNQHAFGNFRALLEAVTLSPAMGVYLSTRGNQKEDARTGRQPDENYAREVMQLFTIGLYRLNPDGTEQRDGSGNRIDTYSAADVSNLARVFTGYDYDTSKNQPTTLGGSTVTGLQQALLPMAFNAARHSTLAATFLGTTVSAGASGDAALKTALDTLFNHPNVGPFIGRQLIQRLVTSNPSPAYVGRVAAAFADNGSGTRGDLRAVIAAVLLDPEARGAAGLANPQYGRLREPMVRFVQWGRTFGLQSARGSWKIDNLSDPATRLGQSPLRSGSVFNFFRPGYVPPSTTLATAGSVAPEFQIVTETSVSGYLNFMQNVIRFGYYVNAPDLPQGGSSAANGFDITCSYANLLPLVGDATALVRKVALLLSAGQVSAATQARIVAALDATPVTATSSAAARLNRVAAAVLLVMASPEYLVQK
ncbi:Protein of uncharacterised function (DUF1800) [Delftia tsuruhatensis]|uniref:DUF1800 domain-containing protein n=1 Tax=Delftia tsuruhatensis TaxID=180282 RepID=UPI001E74215C|nr:DUF1800 domain-containing protein [Delftia tsuruhatensis]CAB5723879.1 Protein of uncharacterised function (DUF1800) [Delftia tsuruhatensis]CAC9684167.1 Protein of uncharacterised function (DUF1800) [Delftia tsuruhatensis]